MIHVTYSLALMLLFAVPTLAQPRGKPAPAPVVDGSIVVDCSTQSDDTAVIQAAIVSADTAPYRHIRLPAHACTFTDTLVFGGRTDRYSSISVQGHSEYTSILQYAGPSDRPAILISHMSAFRWSQFAVERANYTRAGVGVQLDGPFGSGGTMNTGISFEHMEFIGFGVGLLPGGGDAASEVECRQCTFRYNAVGWTASGYNSLNFWFYGLGLSHNDVGMQIGGPHATDGVHIIGGHSSGNTVADMQCANGFGTMDVSAFRAEIPSGGMFIKGYGCGETLALRSNTVLSACWCAVPVMDLHAWNMTRVEDSLIVGQITHLESNGSIHVSNTSVMEGTPGYPVILFGPTVWHQRVSFLGNMKYGVAESGAAPRQHWFPNASGIWNGTTLEPE